MEQSRELTLCTHGAKCISSAAHYHRCAPLCGYARRASEKRRKADPGRPATIKRVDKAPRHYKCALRAQECPDLECHHHKGRAPVHKNDCSMQDVTDALTKVEGKDAEEAMRLWEQLTDLPVPGTKSSRLSPDAPVFTPAVKRAAQQSALPPRPMLLPHQAFAARLERIDEENLETPRSSTILEYGTSPDRTDDRGDDRNLSTILNGGPSSEEKKLASATVITPPPVTSPCEVDETPPPPKGPPVVDGSTPSSSKLEASPDHGLRLKKYVVFTTHSVRGRRKQRTFIKRAMLRAGLAKSREVLLHNEGSGHVTDNVLALAQSQISVVKYFWQNWENRNPEVNEDSISLFAGTFTHADYAFVFEELAKHVLCHPAFTKMQAALLDGVALRKTVRLRVQSLIGEHPLHHVYSAQQSALNNTITFINNQLLLRGLLDEARKPDQISPQVVDFRKGVALKTSLRTAPLSKSAARKRASSRYTASTALSR